MKFIEIREDFSVCKDEIIFVEKINDTTCQIGTEIGIFKTKFPYNTLISILERKDSDKDDAILEELRMLNKTNQFFAG